MYQEGTFPISVPGHFNASPDRRARHRNPNLFVERFQVSNEILLVKSYISRGQALMWDELPVTRVQTTIDIVPTTIPLLG
jgi:hypothetical protein